MKKSLTSAHSSLRKSLAAPVIALSSSPVSSAMPASPRVVAALAALRLLHLLHAHDGAQRALRLGGGGGVLEAAEHDGAQAFVVESPGAVAIERAQLRGERCRGRLALG